MKDKATVEKLALLLLGWGKAREKRYWASYWQKKSVTGDGGDQGERVTGQLTGKGKVLLATGRACVGK